MTDIHLDPVQAYDRIAPAFASLSDRRRAYLDAIEKLVIDRLVIAGIPPSSRSLLDIGAGDGTRAARIAQAVGAMSLVLLEPSAEMRKRWPAGVQGWPVRAEQLSERSGSFDVILCLWNVLGHIFPAESRVAVLRECARLLSPQGRLFLDVNYRYNAWHYGIIPTLFRALHDRLRPSQKNGDVTVRWNVDGARYRTDGHVFTHAEFRQMAHTAGLIIEKKFTVSYATGKVSPWSFAGNPLYLLRPANRPNSFAYADLQRSEKI